MNLTMSLLLGACMPDRCSCGEEWTEYLKRENLSAACFPVGPNEPEDMIADYARAADKAGIVIAECGAWSNPLDPDSAKAKAATEQCQATLALADRVGARCCVNIVGSRNPDQWDAPDARNFSQETFDMVVESVQKIVDAVKPTRTFYTLETMPWMFPADIDQYLRLLTAIDRPKFVAVHFDPCNLINSPVKAYDTTTLLNEFCEKLGPLIRSCHAKDIALRTNMTTHLDEVMPGTGCLDYSTYLRKVMSLECPLIIEHLPDEASYRQAVSYIRGVEKAL